MDMIKKADVLERLTTLIGKELTSENLHEAIFCEEKHRKIIRRFHNGTHTYIQYKIMTDKHTDHTMFADITIPGNPNTFRLRLEEQNGKVIVLSEPRINFSYL